ncbi:DUF320 domain-containing protein [Streptomyces sp. MST-110588]|nr:DUF320 domain-containing protein [Streptomyces sp. MST-110588]
MQQIVKQSVLVVAAATGVLASVGGTAHADSIAGGQTVNSPGVIAGNLLQVPVHVPLNLCGNTVDIIGLLNPAFGNRCINPGGYHAPPRDQQPPEHEPPGHKPSGHGPSGDKPSGDKPPGHKPSGHKPSGHKPPEHHAPPEHHKPPEHHTPSGHQTPGHHNPPGEQPPGHHTTPGHTPPGQQPPGHTPPGQPDATGHEPPGPQPPSGEAGPGDPRGPAPAAGGASSYGASAGQPGGQWVRRVGALAQSPSLARTGAGELGTAAGASVFLLLGGVVLVRRGRAGRR